MGAISDSTLQVALKASADQRLAILTILAALDKPSSASEIADKGVSVGLRKIKSWNVPQVLTRAEDLGYVVRLPNGWQLMPDGLDLLKENGVPLKAKLVATATHSLHTHIASITDPIRRAFIQEAVDCFEAKLNRAAVVLSWIGAVWILQNHVVDTVLYAFNAALAARFPKAKPIKTIKSFVSLGEADFLQVCKDAGIIDKAEKKQLTQRLDLRNDCGHPNNIIVGEHTVAHHLEFLLQNVYEKY